MQPCQLLYFLGTLLPHSLGIRGLIVGGGLAYAWQRAWLKITGTCGLPGAAITLHAIYNPLIAHGGAAQYIAYALPVLLVAVGKLSAFRFGQRK